MYLPIVMLYLSLECSFPYNKEQSVEFDSYIPENSIEDIMFNNVVSGHRMLGKEGIYQ